MYATSVKPTPLFNTENLEKIFWDPTSFDDRFLLRQLETVVYPGSLFEVISAKRDVLEVRTEEYQASRSYFIHRHFVEMKRASPKPRDKNLPSKQEILRRLETFPKSLYIWGGNIPEGIPELLHLFPPNRRLSPFEYACLQFQGVDCSGLLYHVTNGFTPRNTRDLLFFGEKVDNVKPLDLIVWPGHLLIALPGERLIECREFDGLVISNQKVRLKELEEKNYTIIRW